MSVPAASLVAAIIGLASAACTRPNPAYCDRARPCTEPDRPICVFDDGSEAGHCAAATCTGSADCTAEAPICDGACRGCDSDLECMALNPDVPLCAGGECVQCNVDADCSDQAMPACIANRCSRCTEHDQCSSRVCDLEQGACVGEGAIVYVELDGSDVLECGAHDAPCQTLGRGLELVTEDRPIIHLGPGTYEESVALFNRSAQIVGPGAVLTGDSGIPIQVLGNSVVSLDGLGISSSSTGLLCAADGGSPVVRARMIDVFNNGGDGIESTQCDFRIEDSNVANNDGRGLYLNGTFTVLRTRITGNQQGGMQTSGGSGLMLNNIIANNGPSELGGVLIGAGTTGEFSFNSVFGNRRSDATAASAVQCDAGAGFVLSSNIVYGNSLVGGQVGGNCSWRYSLVEGGVDGEGNLVADPKWVDAEAGDFHLAPDSPAIDVADPEATLAVDFEGEPRPAGDGYDMGADEAAAPRGFDGGPAKTLPSRTTPRERL